MNKIFKVAAVAVGILVSGISVAAEAPTPGGTWKIVYSSAEGPQGRALEVLTERIGFHLLRERHLAIPLVLPIEQDGGEPVKGKRDMIVVGRVQENATLRKYLGKDAEKLVPKDGYLIRTLHDGEHDVVLLAGDTPEAVLWAAFDFLDVQVPLMEGAIAPPRGRYPGTFFRANKRNLAKFDKEKEKRIPVRNIVCAPQTPVRSVFSWGHEMDDYRATFREMARARFNRIIIWNNQRVINARDVVEEAHSWGIKVFWGFAWGWSLHCDKADIHNLRKLSDNIIDEWHRIWKPMGGDGIYFQSFTETDRQELAGRSIAEAVVELVNMTAKRIHAESPELDIVFGLHSNSIRKPGATDFIAKTDPSLGGRWPDRRAGQRVLREDPRAHAVRRLCLEGAAVPRLEELDRAGRAVHARMRRAEDAGVPPVDHAADAVLVRQRLVPERQVRVGVDTPPARREASAEGVQRRSVQQSAVRARAVLRGRALLEQRRPVGNDPDARPHEGATREVVRRYTRQLPPLK